MKERARSAVSNGFQKVVRNLSDREREVLGHLAHGDTYVAIARRMNVSHHTVDTYLRRIRAKTGARSRMHLLLLALSLTDPDGAQTHGITSAGTGPPPDGAGLPEGDRLT